MVHQADDAAQHSLGIGCIELPYKQVLGPDSWDKLEREWLGVRVGTFFK